MDLDVVASHDQILKSGTADMITLRFSFSSPSALNQGYSLMTLSATVKQNRGLCDKEGRWKKELFITAINKY